MADIRLAKPAAGTTQTVPSAPDGRFIFDFPADAATLTRSGDNLVLTFEDGASIQLQDFYTTYSKEEMPSFQVEGVEISGQDFYQSAYGVIFDSMVELFNEGRPVDLVTLQDRLKEKDVPPEISSLEFVRDLVTAVPTSANVKYYAEIVADKSMMRRLIKLNDEINILANDPGATSGGIVFLLSIVTCGIYLFYWLYKMGEKCDRIKGTSSSSGILYLILGIVGFSIISYCLMQDTINKAV